AESLSGFHHACPPRLVVHHEKRLLSSPPRMSGADPGRSIPEVQEFADVVKIEKSESGEKADKYRRRGIRTPFQVPRQEPHQWRRPLEQRRVAFPLGHAIVEG